MNSTVLIQDVYFTVHCFIYFLIYFAESTVKLKDEEPKTSKTEENGYRHRPQTLAYKDIESALKYY